MQSCMARISSCPLAHVISLLFTHSQKSTLVIIVCQESPGQLYSYCVFRSLDEAQQQLVTGDQQSPNWRPLRNYDGALSLALYALWS